MQTDWRGLPISAADDALAAAIRRFQVDFQAFRDEAGAIMDIAETAPDCVVAQIYAAAMHVYSQHEAQIASRARPLLDRAACRLGHATPRERLLFAAADAWARADFAISATRFEELAVDWPEDMTAVKFAEFVFFESPDYKRHLHYMQSVAPANASLPVFGAMHAFAHELNGQYDDARHLAEAAIAAEPDTPWAHHALGHMYLNTGHIAEGQRALTGFAPLWNNHGQGIRTHNAWHLALLHLAAMETEVALRLYREHIAQKEPESAFEHTDAISLLWRLELAGQRVPAELWAPFLPFARERAADRVMPFMNAHYIHALARGGDAASARDAIERLAAGVDQGCEPWCTGIPLLRGVLALAKGDAACGVAEIEPVLASVSCVGGSDAQNDLFLQAFLVGLVRAGRTDDARAMLARRIGARQPTAQEESWLQAA